MDETNNKIEIEIEAVDSGWIMGDKLKVKIKANESMLDIAQAIHKLKGISKHRMTFIIPPKRIIPIEKWNDCISSFGICDGSIINVTPTFSGCWQWESQQYYINQMLKKLIEIVEGKMPLTDKKLTDDKRDFCLGLTLEEIKQMVSFPPPMKYEKMLFFIRKYPEIFHVEVDTVLNVVNVTLNKNKQLPVWL